MYHMTPCFTDTCVLIIIFIIIITIISFVGKSDSSSTRQVPGYLSSNAQIALTSAYAVTFLVALFGNSFGLFVVLKKSTTRETNLFIANMAVV